MADVPVVRRRVPPYELLKQLGLRTFAGPLRRRRRSSALPPSLTTEETARRLFALPVRYWTYDFEPGVRHLGPMSQDFAAAFGLARTNRKIHMGDAAGIQLMAIQVLHQRLTDVEHEIDRLTRTTREDNTMSKNRTDKFRPTDDDSALEQTEAHGYKMGVESDDEQTEAHGFRMGAESEDEDTEGHKKQHRT